MREIKGKELKRYVDFEDAMLSFHEQFNYEENHRAVVISGVAFLEDALLHILENKLPSCSTAENLLGHRGALGNFSAKVDMIYCLGLFPKVIKQDLDIIGQIRNKFAHELDASFENEKIVELCAQLKWHEEMLMRKAPPEATAFDVFKVGLNAVVSHLSGVVTIARGEKIKIRD